MAQREPAEQSQQDKGRRQVCEEQTQQQVSQTQEELDDLRAQLDERDEVLAQREIQVEETQQQVEAFARDLCAEIERLRQQGGMRRLYLVAAPAFQGGVFEFKKGNNDKILLDLPARFRLITAAKLIPPVLFYPRPYSFRVNLNFRIFGHWSFKYVGYQVVG